MEGDLRINVPPAHQALRVSQCQGPAVTAIRRLKVKMLIVGTNQRRKGRNLNGEVVLSATQPFIFCFHVFMKLKDKEMKSVLPAPNFNLSVSFPENIEVFFLHSRVCSAFAQVCSKKSLL